MISKKQLSKYGFSLPPEPNLNRIVLAIYGNEKQGKSHFALTAPRPIAYFDFDKGIQRPLRNFAFADGELLYTTYDTEPVKQDINNRTLLQFIDSYKWAIRSGEFRTCVIDTGSALWELIRLAKLGRLTSVKPHHYNLPNAMYRELLEIALSPENGTNLILLHKYKKQYKQNKKGDDSWTGKMEPKWQNETGYLVEIHGEIYKDRDREAEGAGWNLHIMECGINPELEDSVFTTTYDDEVEDETPCDFPTLASYATGTDLENW